LCACESTISANNVVCWRLSKFKTLASVDIAAHLGDQIAQNPNFGGVNKDFTAKRAKN